jgi:RNA polymerase sigma-70 factor (ECF subfamily)
MQHDIADLYERYALQIRRFIAARVGDPDLADDLLSDTFERVLRGLPDYGDRGWPISAWIYRIAYARTIDELRQQAQRPSVPLDEWRDAIPVDGPEAPAVGRATLSELGQTMRQALTAEQHALLWWRFVEDWSLGEIAARMRTTKGAVKALQHRGLERMAGVLRGQRPPVAARAGRRYQPHVAPVVRCAMPGCIRAVAAHGFCASHAARLEAVLTAHDSSPVA